MDGEDGAALDAAQLVRELDRVFAREVGADLFEGQRISAGHGILSAAELFALLGDLHLVDEPLDLRLRIAVGFEDAGDVLVALLGLDVLERLFDLRLAADLELGAVLLGAVRVRDEARVLARVAALDSADGQAVDRAVLFDGDGLAVVDQLLSVLDPACRWL